MRFLLPALVLFLLAGPAHAELRIVASTSDVASLVEEVGGDRVDVDFIVSGRWDPHYVELLPSYMLKVKRADMFFLVGLQLEIWAPGLLDGARNRDLTVVDLSHGIETLEVPAGPVSAEMGDIHAFGNPHYWLDPANGFVMARNVRDALVREDPEGTAVYDANLAAFTARLEAASARWHEALAPYEGMAWITFHNTWPYLNRAFGFEAAGFVEPKPGVSPSPGHTARTIDLVRERGIRLIGIAPFYDRRVPDQIAKETGAKVVVLASSVGGVEGADDYLSLFETNVARLLAALEEKP